MEQNKSSNLPIILGVLLLMAAAVAVYFGIQHTQAVKEAAIQQAEIDSLIDIRTALEQDVDRLNTEYSLIAIENDSLKGSLENARQVIAQREAQLRRAQRRAANDAAVVKEQIAALESEKKELAATINRLEVENRELKENNAALQEQLSASQEANTNLQSQVGDLERANTLLEQRTSELANSSFKTTAMQVNIAKRNDKSTIRSRKVRKFKVSFDLVDVPDEYQGEQTLYLTITDPNGVSIGEAGEKVKVGLDQQALVIEALEKKNVNIGATQRLEFTHELETKLKKGFLIFSVYAEKGLLGSTMFQLI